MPPKRSTASDPNAFPQAHEQTNEKRTRHRAPTPFPARKNTNRSNVTTRSQKKKESKTLARKTEPRSGTETDGDHTHELVDTSVAEPLPDGWDNMVEYLLTRARKIRFGPDMDIICRRTIFHVHQDIVLTNARCKYFKDSVAVMAKTIDLRDDKVHPAVWQCVLDWMYTGSYSVSNPALGLSHTCKPSGLVEGPNSCAFSCKHHSCITDCQSHCKHSRCSICGNEDGLKIHARMYVLAERYEIHNLKNIVLEKFQDVLNRRVVRKDFAKAVAKVWPVIKDDPDDLLREVIVAYATNRPQCQTALFKAMNDKMVISKDLEKELRDRHKDYMKNPKERYLTQMKERLGAIEKFMK